MRAATEVHLFGSLGSQGKGSGSHPIQYALQAPMPLNELMGCLEIPSNRVQLVMVNYRAVSLDHMIHPGDRVALFPKEYLIFADWKNFRA